jgi:tetratricopeptide (TPR) repeat protein
MSNRTTIRWTGLAIAAGALLLYASQGTAAAFPDVWSSALYSILGLDPFRPLSNPLWQLLMAAIGRVAGPAALPAANAFSMVMGALSVWLVFQIGLRFRAKPRLLRSEEDLRRFERARWVAGAVSAVFLAVSAPMLVVSSRLHPYSLGLALLLGATLLALLYRDRPRAGYWFGFALLYGLGAAEFSTFFLLGPVFLCWWIWMLWRSQALRPGMVVGGVALGLLGLSVGLLFCLHYAKSPVAEWREFSGFGEVVRYYLIDHYQQIRYSVPKHGWLIVLLTMVFPVVFIIWNGFEEAGDLFTNIGLAVFRLILLAVAVLILFNLPGSPWHVLGPQVTLVTPYALTALWFGQLCGFAADWLSRPSLKQARRRTAVSPWPGRLFLGLLAATLAAAAVVNVPKASPRQAAPVVALARDVLDAAGDTPFLLTNGSLDPVMQWIAFAEDRPVRLINRVQAGSRAYMRFVATWFDQPELVAMAEAGMGPFLDVWFSGNTNAAAAMAVQDLPEFWTLQGLAWSPGPGLYRGEPLESVTLAPERIEATFALLERHLETLGDAAPRPVLLENTADFLGRQLAVLANNLGFFLVEQGQPEPAERAFSLARSYDPGNLSALMNLIDLATEQGRNDEAAQWKEEVRRKTAIASAPITARQLMRQYGYVRNPAFLMQEGIALIRSGITGQGMDRFDDALAMPDANQSAALVLARTLFDAGQIAECHRRLVELVAQEPGNAAARLLLARCEVVLGKIPEAEQSFAILADLGVPAVQRDMERAFALLQAGRPADALPLFEQGLGHDAVSGPSAVGMIWAASRLDRSEPIQRAEAVLKQRPAYFTGQIVLYELAMARGDLIAAREHLQSARRSQPGNAEVLEKTIRLELLEGREAIAKEMLNRLLEVDSANPYGNYLLSGIHEQNGRLDLAEAVLLRAIPRDLTGEASYGLAWVLEKTGRPAEALTAIDQALTLQPRNPQFLAVKGIVLDALGDSDQAITLINQAITLRGAGTVPLFDLFLARIHHRNGRTDQTRDILNALASRQAEFTPEAARIFSELSSALNLPTP